jgi:hypothetical protein
MVHHKWKRKWAVGHMVAGGAALVVLLYLMYEFYLYNGPRQAHYHRASSISLAGEKLGGLELLEDMSRLTPLPSPDWQTKEYGYYSLSEGMTVAVALGEKRIVRIITSAIDSQVKTSRAIGTGATRAEVLQAYGTFFYERQEQGAPILGYIDKKLHYTLEFWFHGEQVQKIRYDLDWMR